MNGYFKKIILLLCAVTAGLLTSCVYEDETECPCEVRFIYDYNMEYADAFPTQVDDLTLFVFDAEERFVTSVSDHGDHLDENYRMNLSLQPGSYRLVAWAGEYSGRGCYRLLDNLTPGVSTLNDLRVELDCNSTEYDRRPANLWHGILSDFEVAASTPTRRTMSLVKNNNNIKILFQTLSGEKLHKEDYSLAIVGSNYSFEYDNSLSAVPLLNYRPHQLEEVVIENDVPSGDEGASDVGTLTRAGTVSENGISALVGEIGTLRLMANRSPRFVIRNENKKRDIFNIDLCRYIDMMRLSEHASMPLQEFLDRENTYYVILVMDQKPDGTQVMISMQINAWRIVFNENEL